MQQAWKFARSITPALMLAAIACTGAPAAASERFTFDDREVSLYNLVGEVTVEPTDGPMFVEIERAGTDAGDLEIRRGEDRGRQTLQVVYPARRIRSPYRNTNTTIRVDDQGRFGNIRGNVWSRREVRIGRDGMDARANMRIGVPRGSDIAVYLGVGKMEAHSVDADVRLDGSAADVVTSDTHGRLVVDTGSGSVGVKNATGDLTVDTGSGDVYVSDADAGRLYLDTGSGSVVVNTATAGQVTIDTGSGAVRVSGLRSEEILVDTGSGRVEIELDGDVRDLSVDTGSGDVVMRVSDDLGARLLLETGSGSIRVDRPVQASRRSSGYWSGTIGDGKGSVVVDTGSGDIVIH